MVNIIEYQPAYDEEIKDLFWELQEYIVSLDEEKYNILTDHYREAFFIDTMKEINENNGKLLLAKENNKIVGLIVGIINPAENSYDFCSPKRGRITELIITKDHRSKKTGQLLMKPMEQYLKDSGCKAILIEVFGYNENAKNFYHRQGYKTRLYDLIKVIK